MSVVLLIKACIGLAALAVQGHSAVAEVASLDESHVDLLAHGKKHAQPDAATMKRDAKKNYKDALAKTKRIEDAAMKKEHAKRLSDKAKRQQEERDAKIIDKLQNVPDWDKYVFGDISEECEEHEMRMTPGTKDDKMFKCKHGGCTPIRALCNGLANCVDNSDEDGCDATTIKENIVTQMKAAGLKPSLIAVATKDIAKDQRENNRIPAQDTQIWPEPAQSGKKTLDGLTMKKPDRHDRAEHRRRTGRKQAYPVHIHWDAATGTTDATGFHPRITSHQVYRKSEAVAQDSDAASKSTERLMMRRDER